MCSGGSKGGAPGAHPPTVQNFLNFMQFLGKFIKIIGRRPLPGGLTPPPTENPGSAPDVGCNSFRILREVTCLAYYPSLAYMKPITEVILHSLIFLVFL